MAMEYAAYAGMFWTAFLAATLLPGASEVLFAGLLVGGAVDPWLLLLAATIGNTAGSVVNWFCGRFLSHYRDRRWFPVPARQIERASAFFRRYGMWSLLLAWAPIGGDALTVIAGMLRVRLLPFTILVGAGKLARYLFVAGAASAWAA